MARDEEQLPAIILSRASQSNEYAWRVGEIPDVIKAAKDFGMVNIGGQLQFRFPGAICECYWVDVDTFRDVPKDLPWSERVTQTAEVALIQFERVCRKYDFAHEGATAFGDVFAEYGARGWTAEDAMWFVWYVECNAKERWYRKLMRRLRLAPMSRRT